MTASIHDFAQHRKARVTPYPGSYACAHCKHEAFRLWLDGSVTCNGCNRLALPLKDWYAPAPLIPMPEAPSLQSYMKLVYPDSETTTPQGS